MSANCNVRLESYLLDKVKYAVDGYSNKIRIMSKAIVKIENPRCDSSIR